MSDVESGRRFLVVGVDGSDSSSDALAWAVRQARRTDSDVRAVMAWHVPLGIYGAAMPKPLTDDVDEGARQALSQVVAGVVEREGEARITEVVRHGHPTPVLMEEADGAELLVVGSRCHGAFAGLLLGSVSSHLAAHAPCPVVIVRHPA